ncbi:DUF5819 family protein [Streptomyces sp. NPDC017202]|uniref:DUF5819 family protein n=1 Tax=Streptomyces sp. NPDC017202 TaxID=3364981 RepID=UPI0037A7F21D
MKPPSESTAGRSTSAAPAAQCLPPPRPDLGGVVPAPEPETIGAHLSDGGGPAPATGDGVHRGWSRVSVGALAATALLLTGALLAHVVLIFLILAPTNALTAHHQKTVDSLVRPQFGQDWKLFAPNPKQRNDSVGVRLRTIDAGGTGHVSGWINLTAQDVAAIKGDPAPSHVTQNMLRTAWDGAESWHDRDNRPKGARGVLADEYLKRIALQRLGRRWQGERITGVQFAGRYMMVPPPSWSSEKTSDTTAYRVFPWWPVTDQDYRGL